jgi:hypothetical protein
MVARGCLSPGSGRGDPPVALTAGSPGAEGAQSACRRSGSGKLATARGVAVGKRVEGLRYYCQHWLKLPCH